MHQYKLIHICNMGFNMELSEKSSNLRYHLEEPIHLNTDKDWQKWLTSSVVYNSINNLTEKNNELILLILIESILILFGIK